MPTVTTDPGRGSEAREAAIHTNRKAPAEPLAGQRTLVTGATGFIGARLCEYLRATGAEPHPSVELDVVPRRPA